MTTAQQEVREIRKQLVESGADPYEVAALALEQARRLREQLTEAVKAADRPRLAPVRCLRPPACKFG
jgi:hypothetical protein